MPPAIVSRRGLSHPHSGCTVVADAASGHHLLTVNGYSRTKGLTAGEILTSRPFIVAGYRWRIDCYNPRSSPAYIAFQLVLDDDVVEAVKAQFQFTLSGQNRESWTWLPITTFDRRGSWGMAELILRETFEKPEHLRVDSFAIRCDIVVLNEPRAEHTPEAAPPTYVSVPPSDLHRHLGDLLLDGKGADVVFEVGGEEFAAHRCVLAARSPVFNAELFGAMRESTTGAVIRIDDMDAQVFKALISFVYTDSLPEMKEEVEDVMSQHLLVAADRYNMERLKLICEEKLCNHIEVSTVVTIMALAEQHQCDGLKKACFDFLRAPENLRAIVDSDGLEDLSRSCPSVISELIAMLNTLLNIN